MKILDVEAAGLSSWAFAKVDAVVTLIILLLFGLMSAVRSNIKVLCLLLVLVTCGTATLGFVAFNYDGLQLPPMTWLFLQSLSLYTVYLSFQTLFFERFIACFRIKGNVGSLSSHSILSGIPVRWWYWYSRNSSIRTSTGWISIT